MLENIPLAPLTSFKIGGPARWYCPARSVEDVTAALEFARKRDLPWFVLGRGSNVLVADRGFDGVIVHLAGIETLELEHADQDEAIGGRIIHSGAGLAIASLAKQVAEEGLSGLEFAGGLPGSVGGAVYMNARAYGGEIADVFVRASVVTPLGEIASRDKADMCYAYKHSALMESEEIVITVDFRLTPAPDQATRLGYIEATTENQKKRIAMGQFTHPNAGCAFKNDYACGIPSGKLIDESGLRGYSIGGAAVFERHANFVVNTGSASAEDVRRLINHIRDVVLQKQGIRLEEEVRYLGFTD